MCFKKGSKNENNVSEKSSINCILFYEISAKFILFSVDLVSLVFLIESSVVCKQREQDEE